MRGAFRENRARIADINSQIEDSLSGIRVVKSFSNEETEMDKFEEGNSRFVASKKRTYRFMGSYNSGMGVFSTLITVGSLLMGAWLMMKGELSAADLVTFLLYINNFTEPVKKLVNFTEQFQNGYSGYERFLEIMSIAPDIKDKEDAQSLDRVKGEIQFEDVSFHYSENKENVLSHVNLDVKPGQKIAIVGPTGCGKTTLINLLMRFYDVTGGQIKVENIDIREVTRKSLRAGYGMVLQDTWLKTGTIRENITMGRPDATEEEIIEAAKASHIHSYISRLPKGYDTWITEDGGGLSQGQKQLLCIARVMLCRPPMLILDEATSSIDTRTELKIQQAFAKLMEGRTTFIVAHRLSTIREADVILVMKDGKVIEQGNHEKGGFYRHLYESQFAH